MLDDETKRSLQGPTLRIIIDSIAEFYMEERAKMLEDLEKQLTRPTVLPEDSSERNDFMDALLKL